KVKRVASQAFLLPDRKTCPQLEDRIDGVWIVEVVGCDARCVGRPGRLRLEHLPKETAGLNVSRENGPLADVLVDNGGGEIFPLRILRIIRRLAGIKRDVTRAAGDADPIRPDQTVRDGVVGIVIVTIPVPLLYRVALEIGVFEQPETHDAGRMSINLGID